MVLTTVPTTALTVYAEESDYNDGNSDEQSDADNNEGKKDQVDSGSELTDEEKAAAEAAKKAEEEAAKKAEEEAAKKAAEEEAAKKAEEEAANQGAQDEELPADQPVQTPVQAPMMAPAAAPGSADAGVMPLATGDATTFTATATVTGSTGGAMVTFTDDCLAEDKVKEETPIKFTVTLADGYKLSDAGVTAGDLTVTGDLENGFSIANSSSSAISANVAITVPVEPVKASYTVTGGTDNAGVQLTPETGANTINKTTGAAIDPTKPISFKVTGLDGLTLSKVEYTVGSGTAEPITPSNDVYSVPLTDVNDDITITVTVEDKTYTVKAPTAGAAYGITWQVKETSGSYGTTADLTSGQGLTAQATLAATSAYNVTQLKSGATPTWTGAAGNTKTSEVTFTFAEITALTPGSDGKYDINSLLNIAATKVQAPVTIAKADTSDANSYTVQWAYADASDPTKPGTFKTVSGTSFAPDKNQKVFLKITAKTGYVIQGVAKKSGSISVDPLAKDEDGNATTSFTATPPDDETEANANVITVTTKKVTKVLNVKLGADAQVASVKYIEASNAAANAVKTASGWEVRSEDSSVKIVVEPKAHNEIVCIHNAANAATHKIENGACTGTKVTTTGTGTLTTDAADMSGASFNDTYTIYTKKITVPYKLVADETTFGETDAAKVTFTVEDESGSAVAKNTAAGTLQNTYILEDGKTYRIKIAGVELADIAEVKTDKAAAEALKYNANLGAFVLPAAIADKASNDFSTITVKKQAAEGKDVSFAMKAGSTTGKQIALLKVNGYKKVTAGAVSDQTAEASATEITGNRKAEGALVGGSLSFTLDPQDPYRIKEVTAVDTENSNAAVPFTVSGSTYTIAKVTGATTVTVETELDPNKAHSITVEGDENVTLSADPIVTNGVDINFTADKKTIYVATGAATAVTLTYTVADGYTTDKVTANGVALEPTPSGTITVDFAADDAKQTKAYKISTKEANAVLEDDKFVKFTVGTDVALQVTEPADLAPVSTESGITYKLAADVTDADGKVTTPGVHEMRFDLLVPYGKELTYADLVAGKVTKTAEKRMKSADGESWVYSYKVVASQLTGTTKETADAVSTGDAADETIALTKKTGSADFKIKSGGNYDSDFSNTTATHGQTVSLKIAPGQTLEINGEQKNVDEDYIYSFVAELDDTKAQDASAYEINVKNVSDYQLKYVRKAKGEAAPADDTDAVKADENVAIETDYEDSVYVFLEDMAGNGVAISDVEVTENAKSTTTVAAAQDAAGAGKATIVMKDASYTVKFYTVKDGTIGGVATQERVLAATINLVSNNADGKTLTVDGIKNGATVKLDATGVAYFPMTLKDGREVLDVTAFNLAVAPATDAEAAKAAANASLDADGNLVIKTLKAGETEEFKITAPGVEKPLMTFKVEGQTPGLWVKKLDSMAQGMKDIMINLTPDENAREVSSDFDLYYEVTVAKVEGPSTTDKVGVYYLPATETNNGKKFTKAVSQFFQVNNESGATAQPNTYSFSARIVAVANGTVVGAGTPTTGIAGTKITGSALKFATPEGDEYYKEFTTRTDYYEDKLKVTKKNTKLFSGQDYVTVAVPKFSNNAGHINVVQVEVLNKDGSVAQNMQGTYDPATMEVKVRTCNDAGDTHDSTKRTAGSYDVMIYATADPGSADKRYDGFEMYRATAKIPITVQKGIHSITLAEKPSQIAMIADNKGNKKDVTLTLKPIGWYGVVAGKDVKAQSQKFRYEITGLSAKNAGTVTVKGNKITISKTFVISNDPDNNKFTINLYADDYTGNTNGTISWPVEVTNKALEIGKVQLIKAGKPLPATISTLDLQGATLKVTDIYGNDINASAVTITPNKGKVYAWNNSGTWTAAYTGYTKTVTFKAKATDGSKGKGVDSIKYTINYPSVPKYGIKVWNGGSVGDDTDYDNTKLATGALLDWTSDYNCSYKGTGNDLIAFYVAAIDKDGLWKNGNTAKFSYTVKISGGKNLTGKNDTADGWYKVQPNAEEVKIVITDKLTKKPYTFTLRNSTWQKTAAPKATTKNKLYNVYYADAVGHTLGDPIPQDLVYTVKKAEGYNRVKLTWLSGNGVTDVNGTYTIANGEFTIPNVTVGGVGKDKYSVVYGVDDGGNFVPKTKETTLAIKTNKVSNPKATNKYNINPNESWGVKLSVKPVLKESSQGNSMISYEAVQAGNLKGKMNRFTEFFEVDSAARTLRIRSDVRSNPDKMAELTALAADKDGKKHLEGYLVYKYNLSGGAGGVVTKIEKITVTLNDKTTGKGGAYAATEVKIVGAANAEAKTTVKLDGTALPIAQVTTDTAGWAASFTSNDDKNAGVVTLRATGVPASGSVNLYVIPQGSRNENEAAPDKIMEVGIKLTVKVTVQAEGANTSKITVTKTAKEPTAAIAGDKVQLTVAFTKEAKDFAYVLDNAQISAAAKADSTDERIISAIYTSADEGTITLVLDRAKINPTNADIVVNVPVKVSFTAGADETVTFPVKLKKALTMADVKSQIESKLNNTPVGAANYGNGTNAAGTVNTKLTAMTGAEPMASELVLAGVTVGTAAAATGYGTSNHNVEITLTDVTLTGEAATTKAVVTVSEAEPPAAAPANPGAAITALFGRYAIPDAAGDVADGKIAITKAMHNDTYGMKNAIKNELDRYWAGNYIVNVTDVTVTTVPGYDSEGNEIETISQMSVTYSVHDDRGNSVVTSTTADLPTV